MKKNKIVVATFALALVITGAQTLSAKAVNYNKNELKVAKEDFKGYRSSFSSYLKKDIKGSVSEKKVNDFFSKKENDTLTKKNAEILEEENKDKKVAVVDKVNYTNGSVELYNDGSYSVETVDEGKTKAAQTNTKFGVDYYKERTVSTSRVFYKCFASRIWSQHLSAKFASDCGGCGDDVEYVPNSAQGYIYVYGGYRVVNKYIANYAHGNGGAKVRMSASINKTWYPKRYNAISEVGLTSQGYPYTYNAGF